MTRWERHYGFASRPSQWAAILTLGNSDRWYNYRKIRIGYNQAGFEEFRPRRILHDGHEPIGIIDDREYDLVFGDYDLRTRTALIWACGPNMSDQELMDQHIVVR